MIDPAHAPSGVIVIDKPKGPTSHDVVAKVRRTLRTREVGHAGTLDPMASGVLVVAVGEATKLSPYLTSAEKAYEATVRFGIETDTLDAEGAVVAELEPPDWLWKALASIDAAKTCPQIDAALAAEAARTLQIPPAYSAIKTDGVRAYEHARRGDAIELAPRAVAVTTIALVAVDLARAALTIALEVSKGYYVRSFARDLATRLETKGHLIALRRVRSGSFGLQASISPDAPRGAMLAAMLPLAQAASLTLSAETLTESGVRRARFGQALTAEDFVNATEIDDGRLVGPRAWFDEQGRLIAIGAGADGESPRRVLRGFRDL